MSSTLESCKNAAKVFRLYTNPRASSIIESLQISGSLSVTDLVDVTGFAQTNVSAILKKLQDAGIVKDGEQNGKFTYYSLNKRRIQVIKKTAQYF